MLSREFSYDVLRRVESAGADGVTVADIAPIHARGRVKDGFEARRNAGAGGFLCKLASAGYLVRVGERGGKRARWARYHLTAQGREFLRSERARARELAGQ